MADEAGRDPQSSADALAAGVAAIWERFRGTVGARVSVLEDAAVALLSGSLDDDLRRRAEREAHRLAGSVGTFGFADASRLARSLELLLTGTAPLTAQDALKLSSGALTLRERLEHATAPLPAVPVTEQRPVLLVVSTDTELLEQVGLEAEGRGFAVRSAAEVNAADAPPAAALLDLDSDGALAALDALAVLDPSPPAVVLSRADALSDRVAAVQRGAAGFLGKPVSPVRALDLVARTLAAEGVAGTRVMLVDDDETVLAVVAGMLGAAGAEVAQVNDPAGFWSELGRIGPDIVVLDYDMPGFTGPELCRALRADPRWQSLPVIFLSARVDADSIQTMFGAGGDDYVSKPVVGRELLERIRNRVDRARLHATLASSSGPGGLPARERASAEIERMLRLATRLAQPLALARIVPTDFARIRAALGHAATAEVLGRIGVLLQSQLPDGDLVAWWGDDEFVATFFGETADGAADRLRTALESVGREWLPMEGGRERLHFAAGIAACPADGADLASICERAELARVRAAAGAGAGPCIETAAGRAPGRDVEMVDIAIVEDDPVLADLLVHVFGTRGYRTCVLRDGEEAARRLAAGEGSLIARVILLDIDLPVRSGLSVLRELAEAGVLTRSRVIMLTVRSSEEDVLTSLELGAADHVAKPFSVPVLLQRVRALLERG
jgi:DNA-binding response OmpR family regulator